MSDQKRSLIVNNYQITICSRNNFVDNSIINLSFSPFIVTEAKKKRKGVTEI